MAIDPSVLAKFETLDPLGEAGRFSMAPLLTSTRYRAGAQICREGDEGDACYMLSEGTVQVIKNLPDGRKVKLATLPEGTLFGQAGLVPNQVRTADVKAEGNVTILSLSRATLNWSLNRGEEWAVAMQAIVAVNLVQQLRSALDRLGELAAAEDVSEEVSGTKHEDARKATSLKADFSGARKKTREEGGTLGAAPSGPRAGLLEMLRATESALASAGFNTDNVEFVLDEDQLRTAEARGS
ncbi:MAG: cyclic nucleotide-binding domain-containing protein [Deltaproteobacteria bacterium]|nr:cyclic nucleotide-binding domain-containing protein [Deltaproteobacteria bacterium]